MASASTAPRQPALFAVVLVAVMTLAAFLFGWKLGLKPLENWDEGIHAEVSREMYRQGAALSLSYRDQLYTAKPPLKFWLTTALFPMLGESELAVRLWSAIAGVATVALLGWWIWQWSGSVRLAMLTSVIFASGRYVMFHAFRTGETDGLLVLFTTAALYAGWRTWQVTSVSTQRQPPHRRWFFVFAGFVGLATMTKSVAAVLPVLIAALDLTLARRWIQLGWRTVLWAAALVVAIAGPWHLLMTIQHGTAFWSGYVGFHVLDRVQEILYANVVPWYWYADVAFKRLFPFSVLVPFALVMAVRRLWRQRDELDRLLIIWAAVVFIVFSFVRTKFDWYILPMYPPLAVLIARGISDYLHQRGGRLTVGLAAASFAAIIAILPSAVAHEGWLWRLTPYDWLPGSWAVSTVGKIVVALGTVIAVGGISALLRGRTIIPVTRFVGMALTAYVGVMALGWQVSYLRHLPTTSPLKEIAATVRELRVKQLDVVGVDLLRQPAGYFYLRRVEGLTVEELPGNPTTQYVLTTTDRVQSLSVGRRAILQRDRFVLLGP